MRPIAWNIANRAAWVKRRRTTRRAWLGFTFLLAAFFSMGFWLGEQDYRQWLQQVAQYRQDCSKATSPDCQMLTMKVYEHRERGSLDPDDDTHLWIGLQSKSGQRFEVDTSDSQWNRIGVGASVTATVWNGEVEEVRDSGGTAEMRTNPVWRARDKRLSLTGLELLALIGLCLIPFAFIEADKRHEKQWRIAAGNERGAK